MEAIEDSSMVATEGDNSVGVLLFVDSVGAVARSKAWLCSGWFAGTAGSNPTGA